MKKNLFLFLLSLPCWAVAQSDPGVMPPQPPKLAMLPLEAIQLLYGKTANVDFVYYELPFSMSTEGPDALRDLSFFANEPANPKNVCKPLCRMDFTGGGVFLSSADIYYGDGCNYAVFTYKDVKYSNALSPTGIDFFTKVLEFKQNEKEAAGKK